MEEEMVTITRKEWGGLMADQEMLNALKEAGVDNWSGWPEACKIVWNSKAEWKVKKP